MERRELYLRINMDILGLALVALSAGDMQEIQQSWMSHCMNPNLSG